jgi:hypothetical protein
MSSLNFDKAQRKSLTNIYGTLRGGSSDITINKCIYFKVLNTSYTSTHNFS